MTENMRRRALFSFIIAHRRRDSKANAAVSAERGGRRERGQAEGGATATTERLTESHLPEKLNV
jgi:hypothetical protein